MQRYSLEGWTSDLWTHSLLEQPPTVIRPCTPYASPITSASVHLENWLLFRAPLSGVALLLGMADGASSAEDSPDDDSDLSHTRTTTGHRKCLDDKSNLGCTRTATGQMKHSLISQTVAQREERLAVERLQHIPFFITSSYYTCIFPYTSFSLLYVFTLPPYPFFVITHLSNS